MSSIDIAIETIRSVGDEHCENQAYIFPDYDPMECDATALCQRLGIPYTDDINIRYPANRTFLPIDPDLIAQQESQIGITLPHDYKTLLETLGAVHLPGHANVCIDSPADAVDTTRGYWLAEPAPLSLLAISTYNETSDGDAIGFRYDGDRFGDAVYKFDHELVNGDDGPENCATKIAYSLGEFITEYLAKNK